MMRMMVKELKRKRTVHRVEKGADLRKGMLTTIRTGTWVRRFPHLAVRIHPNNEFHYLDRIAKKFGMFCHVFAMDLFFEFN